MDKKKLSYMDDGYLESIPKPEIIEVVIEGFPSVWKVVYKTRLDWFVGSNDTCYSTKSEALSIAACNLDPLH
jgi:hypothetical protein